MEKLIISSPYITVAIVILILCWKKRQTIWAIVRPPSAGIEIYSSDNLPAIKQCYYFVFILLLHVVIFQMGCNALLRAVCWNQGSAK